MDSIEKIQGVFRLNEPELVLESFSRESRDAVFQLLDCDGYRLGRLLCGDVRLLSTTTAGESFDDLHVASVASLPVAFAWLSEAMLGDDLLLTFRVVDGLDAESVLPRIGDWRDAYLICKSVGFERETNPGR